ncbi:MAG: hypothetical protein M1816_007814 [Peltula sp. TS41687]|nr:MAG: hypothetical protein M1816_007814 [Peltula sp. TS41687]
MPTSRSTSRTQTNSRDTLGESTGKTSTSKTKRTGPYDPNFEQHLIDHGVYPPRYEKSQRPSNKDELLERLAQPRPSLSPSRFPADEKFDQFGSTAACALSEDMVAQKEYPILAGSAQITSGGGNLLNNWAPLTDGTLKTSKPDAYDGANPGQIDKRIREQLGPLIIPSTLQHAPALPNFFAAIKGPDGSAVKARRQACYDGALGARGMHSLQNFGLEESEAVYDDRAYTIASTYYAGNLTLYTTHPTKPLDAESSPEYHMTQLRSFSVTDTTERFREGVSALRNARDWAKEQRDTFIAAANAKLLSTQVKIDFRVFQW